MRGGLQELLVGGNAAHDWGAAKKHITLSLGPAGPCCPAGLRSLKLEVKVIAGGWKHSLAQQPALWERRHRCWGSLSLIFCPPDFSSFNKNIFVKSSGSFLANGESTFSEHRKMRYTSAYFHGNVVLVNSNHVLKKSRTRIILSPDLSLTSPPHWAHASPHLKYCRRRIHQFLSSLEPELLPQLQKRKLKVHMTCKDRLWNCTGFFFPIHLQKKELSKMVKNRKLIGIFREASPGCSWTSVAKSMLQSCSSKWVTDSFILEKLFASVWKISLSPLHIPSHQSFLWDLSVPHWGFLVSSWVSNSRQG